MILKNFHSDNHWDKNSSRKWISWFGQYCFYNGEKMSTKVEINWWILFQVKFWNPLHTSSKLLPKVMFWSLNHGRLVRKAHTLHRCIVYVSILIGQMLWAGATIGFSKSITKMNLVSFRFQCSLIWSAHGNHIGMETLFQIDKNTFICRKRTN